MGNPDFSIWMCLMRNPSTPKLAVDLQLLKPENLSEADAFFGDQYW